MNTHTDLLGDQPQPKLSNGYAGHPGAGPQGETCGSCAHSRAHRMSKTYYKCALIRATHGAATDIKLKTPACERWAREPR